VQFALREYDVTTWSTTYNKNDRTYYDIRAGMKKSQQGNIKLMMSPVPIVRADTDVLYPAGDVRATFLCLMRQVAGIVDVTGLVIPQAFLPELLSLYWPARNEVAAVCLVSRERLLHSIRYLRGGGSVIL
jgi:hypothetical protein